MERLYTCKFTNLTRNQLFHMFTEFSMPDLFRALKRTEDLKLEARDCARPRPEGSEGSREVRSDASWRTAAASRQVPAASLGASFRLSAGQCILGTVAFCSPESD